MASRNCRYLARLLIHKTLSVSISISIVETPLSECIPSVIKTQQCLISISSNLPSQFSVEHFDVALIWSTNEVSWLVSVIKEPSFNWNLCRLRHFPLRGRACFVFFRTWKVVRQFLVIGRLRGLTWTHIHVPLPKDFLHSWTGVIPCLPQGNKLQRIIWCAWLNFYFPFSRQSKILPGTQALSSCRCALPSLFTIQFLSLRLCQSFLTHECKSNERVIAVGGKFHSLACLIARSLTRWMDCKLFLLIPLTSA